MYGEQEIYQAMLWFSVAILDKNWHYRKTDSHFQGFLIIALMSIYFMDFYIANDD